MHFVIDAQLPPGLVPVLVAKGHTAEHIFDHFPPNVTDAEIWQYVLTLNAVIVSKDEDFPRRALASKNAPQVLWLRVGNTSNCALFQWFHAVWPNIERGLQAGERLIEII